MDAQLVYIGLAAAFGLFMAWGIGANDVANAMATSVGSKALTIKQAILVAAIFEFAGAVLAGGEVTSTIRKGIIDAEVMSGEPQLMVYGMMSALLAAGTWLLIASIKGWPVSTTHSIVGAIVGFAVAGIGIVASPVASASATVPESAPKATPFDIRVWLSPPMMMAQSSTVMSFSTLWITSVIA